MEKYFYIDAQGQQRGPVDVEEFLKYGVKTDTLIWRQGMPEWVEAGKVSEVLFIFNQSQEMAPPPPPRYAAGSFAPSTPPMTKPDI